MVRRAVVAVAVAGWLVVAVVEDIASRRAARYGLV
jgi:hypothetical protein